jgi:hypothetical protein
MAGPEEAKNPAGKGLRLIQIRLAARSLKKMVDLVKLKAKEVGLKQKV